MINSKYDLIMSAMDKVNKSLAKDSIGTGVCCNCHFDGLMFKKITKGVLCLECTAKLEELETPTKSRVGSLVSIEE